MDESVISTLLGGKYPQDWTAEEVVAFLSKPPRPLPVQKFFETDAGKALFIDNYITGAVLLDDGFTKDTLKGDLGIRQVGLCILLWNVIQEIRRNYPQRPDIDLTDDSLLPPPPQEDTNSLVLRDETADYEDDDDDGHLTQLVPETRVLKFGHLQRYADEVLLEARVEWSGPLVATPSKLVTRESHSIFRLNGSDDIVPTQFGDETGDDTYNDNEDEELATPQKAPTPRTHVSDSDDDMDVRSPKRPRLDDGGEPEVPIQRIQGQPTQTSENGVDDTMTDIVEEDHPDVTTPQEHRPDCYIVKGDLLRMEEIKKVSGIPLLRLRGHELGREPTVPEVESTASSPPRPSRRSQAPRSRLRQLRSAGYLDRSPITASEMTLVGDDADDTDCFVVINKKVSPGTRMGAARITNAFLHKKSVDTATINGKFHLAYRHHTLRHLHRYKRDPITIINDEEVQVGENLKDHIDNFPKLDVRKQLYRRKSDRVQLMDAGGLDRKRMDPWQPIEDDDYYQALGEKHDLLARLQEGDQFVPVDYRGASPGLDLQTERELRQEQRLNEQAIERKNYGNKLTVQEIGEIWEEVKNQAIRKWREKALPELEKIKYKYWMQAQEKDIRKQMVIRYMMAIRRLETRLNNHWDGYLESNWYSVVELRKFMKAKSKVSIQDREDAIWRRDAIRGKRPERPDSPPPSQFAQRKKVGRARPEAEGAGGEPAVLDEEDIGSSDGDDSDDSESDMDNFIVDDSVYDEGHENMKTENDAVIAQLKNRHLDDELAKSVVLEDDDGAGEQPKPRRRNKRQAAEPPTSHIDEDTELPDAEPEAKDGDNLLPERPRRIARASSDSFRWFSNELPETARNSETSVPKVSLADGDESPATPLPEDPIPTSNGPAIFTTEPITEPEAVNQSATEPVTEPVISINNSDSEFGDTGPFTIEQGTPAFEPATPQPVIKAEHPVRTAFSGGEVIDLTDDTPVSTPVEATAPRPSKNSPRGQRSTPIDLGGDLLDEDTQLQIAIIESRESALKEGVQLSTSPSPVNKSQFPQTLLAGSSSASSSSVANARPRITKPPTICTHPEGITNSWKRDLQAQYDKDPRDLTSLGKLIQAERKRYGSRSTPTQSDSSLSDVRVDQRILDKVIGCWDVSQGKPVDTLSLGIDEQDKPAYAMLARLYSTFVPPPGVIDYKAKKKLLSNLDNFLLFIGELMPILNDVAEYEEGMTGNDSIGVDSLSKSSQAAGPNTKRPTNLESETSHNGVKNKGKGKAKQDALASLLESDSEEDLLLSQRSFLEATSEAEASRSGTSTPRRQKINRTQKIDQETQRIRQQNDRERHKLKERERRGIKAGQTGELINLGHLAKDDPIYFPASDQSLYDFQKAGVQFLWRNIVVSEKRTGALLAHTMGMGKTRQVITVLCAIADAASSEKPRTRNQIPPELRNMRALIVCPPGLIQNWSEEISKWADDALATVYPVTQALSMKARIEYIEKWAVDGTVLIIGYESFSQLCSKSDSVKKGLDKANNEPSTSDPASKGSRIKELEAELGEVTRIEDILLNTPTIVVADEAHKIKTKNSRIARIFRAFKTRSRIAMTGSPLANDLTEYFHIMKWVDPEYAGDEAEFNNNFKLPIRDGLYINSLDEEVKESNKKQRELTTLWGPKMNRVNMKQIKGLENTLPPKTEFLITLPLTELQYKLYGFYAKEAKRDTEEGYYCGFFDFVAQLGVLLNHPALFWKAFEKRQAKKKTKIEGSAQSARITEANLSDEDAAQESSSEVEAEDPDSQKAILGADSAVSDRLQAVITATENLKDTAHSYRIQVLLRILESCIAIKEKVLVFSQSVETLKYIGEVLDNQNIKFVKITGEVSTAKRQTIARGFNNVDSDKFVFLISTKAGGLGLNIQAASRIVVFDSQFSPQDEEQAVGRAYRLGQKKHVFVYRFRVGGTLEDVIHNNSLLKMSLAARLVDRTTPARKAKKSEAADWFRPPKFIPRDPAGFESMRGKDPKVMDKFLEEEWLRELVTQDMYEVHYEEQDGESSKTASEGTEDGVRTESKESDGMDLDKNTTATAKATPDAHTKPIATNTTSTPVTEGSAANSSPATSPASMSSRFGGNRSSLQKQIPRTPKDREDFEAKVQQLSKAREGEKTPAPSSSRVAPPRDTPKPSTQPSRPQAGPSARPKGNLSQPKGRTEQVKGISANKDKLNELKGAQTNSRAPAPRPLVLPSQASPQTLPSQASPRILPSQASPQVLPSQCDRAASSQSPVTPTTPLADRIGQKQLFKRSPRPYASSRFSQPRAGQPTRTQRPGGLKKPYERPDVNRRAPASHPQKPRSPTGRTPQQRPVSERSTQQQQPRPPSPQDRR